MSGQTNLFQSSLITPQGKGSIQFSTGARLKSGTLKESVPVSVNDSVIEEDSLRRRRSPSTYDLGAGNVNDSFIFSTAENQSGNKTLNPGTKLDFRTREKEMPPKRNSNNYNDFSKYNTPQILLTSEPTNYSYKYLPTSASVLICQEDPASSNPQSKQIPQKLRRSFNLAKYKSVSKLNNHNHLHTHSKNDFQFGKKLGKGNFGDVYLVRHKIIGFLFALKVVSKKVVKEKNMEKQILWQASINMTLTHPNITQMYGMFDDHQNIYFIEELMTDGHLFNKMKQTKRLAQEEAAPIVKEIIEGVEYMHRMSMIHRDLKPENILIQMSMYKIGDFSWAIYTPDLLRDTFCGTPLYMSPEILKGEKYDSGVDNWALGILTYEVLVGRPPFKITSPQELSKIITEEIKFPEHINISDNAKDFILKLLNKNPSERIDLDTLLLHPFVKNSKLDAHPQFMHVMS